MLQVDESKLTSKYNEIKGYLDYYNKYGQPLVDEYTADLDTKVKDINTYLYNIRELNLDFDVVSLQRIVMDLSSIIYFTTSRLEQIKLLADMAKVNYKSQYNQMFTSRQGAAKQEDRKFTNDQLKALAEQDAIEEELVSFVYDHVADVIEAKIDAAYELLKACSKSLSAEIQAMQTFKVGG